MLAHAGAAGAPGARARVATASRTLSRQRASARSCAPLNRSAIAASAPLFSAPAIGCAGHELREAPRRAPRAPRRPRRDLVLPASVTTVAGPRCGAMRCEDRARSAPTGAATQHQVGAAHGGAGVVARFVDDAELAARARALAGVRPTPTTRRDRARALAARARTSRRSGRRRRRRRRSTSRFGAARRCERREEALVLLRQADGHAQVLRHAVAADRAHDHALRAAGAGRPRRRASPHLRGTRP